ncbi:GTP pyrophosphokinase family protein [Vibrio cyclitrophicus 1F53]|uniref:GTP pyrophosphokinase n=1 Tax=Vibrio cyclitrophicus TaxID=47951 RepID=UPI0002D424E0|nr:RelA/SpoT domain-containing protein [Vibrio cyclitrophicus]OEF34273.1 hypothetical protein OA7_07855 [Vibrio cyclitrophicus 1F53]OEF66190.1 hypothetical protein OAA_20960 [Vibrio cyclitrophicus 1F175]PMH27303.1 hypothetical protein BCU72_03835 [Vibrio cyclitrophicus]PMH87288.1 hypothetical protein BCU60_09510 [Vibrio cyclitrophicus]
MDKELLKVDYDRQKLQATRFISVAIEQLKQLFEINTITLGTPIESRVKSFASIEEKLQRKSKEIISVSELSDFVGIRVIVLFKSDIEKVCHLVKDNLKVIESEDVAERLEADQFGYQSTHYTVKLPDEWLALPTLSDLAHLSAEIQIRTLSQHIWAVASHKLQYKQENNVPIPLRRSINRVSALLETVDLEFERVLAERESYKLDDLKKVDDDSGFNVDILENILDKSLPPENKHDNHENYSEIFEQLVRNGINSVSKLEEVIESQIGELLEEDKVRTRDIINGDFDEAEEVERAQRGVFFTHVGLIRGCLRAYVGDENLL